MNKKILSTVIAAAMLLSMTALSGCGSKEADTSSVNTSGSDTESLVLELDSESSNSSSDEEKTSSEKKEDSNPDKDDTKRDKASSPNAVSSKAVSSQASSSKAASSKAVSSNSTSSKSDSSKESSDGLTDDEALEIVLNNTDFTKDEFDSIEIKEENGEKFHAVYFNRNGYYVCYVRDSDKKFFTSEEFNVEYHPDTTISEDTSLGIDDKKALAIVLQNTDYTEDELSSNTRITEDGESFHAVTFYRNGTYVFYVRDRDGKFFTYEEFNETYYNNDSPETVEEKEALKIVLDNTDYTEDELMGISENEADGDMFYNIAFFRNGTYVFYVRQRDGRFYTYEDFNKAYNEYFDGYVGHD